jgi:hypothetical protein
LGAQLNGKNFPENGDLVENFQELLQVTRKYSGKISGAPLPRISRIGWENSPRILG